MCRNFLRSDRSSQKKKQKKQKEVSTFDCICLQRYSTNKVKTELLTLSIICLRKAICCLILLYILTSIQKFISENIIFW